MNRRFIMAMAAALFFISATTEAKGPVRVGVYQDFPLSFVDDQGRARGVFVEILDHIAREEGWKLDYVPAPWSECLANLKAGRLDLLGVIALVENRKAYLDYTIESVVTEWGVVYARPKARIESILDLAGRKVAVMKDAIYSRDMISLAKKFGIEVRFVEAFDYETVLGMVASGQCVAGLVSHLYGMQYEHLYPLQKTPIVLSPQRLYYAVPKGQHRDLVQALDKHLRQLKQAKGSVYHRSIQKWLHTDPEDPFPVWIFWVLAGTAGVVITVFSTNILLRQRIRARTRELFEKNEALLAEVEQRRQAEKEGRKLGARLARAKKMEAIGTLAGGVAHDLNNILSGLVSYPELLLMDLPPDSPMKKPIQTMKRSGEKAATIVQDLLTLARRGVTVKEMISINQVVREYLNSPECRKLLDFHPGVRVETSLAPDLLHVEGSPVHLSKTVMNLVSNAAEAMHGGGRLAVKTENRHMDRPLAGYDIVRPGDYVVLSVSDTGAGISEADREKIFEPFYSKKIMGRSGTGLGMTVVWSTVKDHDGYIDIQSTKETGTTFALYFPATRLRRPIDPLTRNRSDYMGRGEHILVVDDVAEQREIAEEVLTRLNYTVTAVPDGETAIAYLRAHKADLVVLDMIMDPGIDGLATYRHILEIHPHQKAIIASGFSESDRVKEALALGVGNYIKKPYLMETIGVAVREELDK
jgi:signal transduction histidine kinase